MTATHDTRSNDSSAAEPTRDAGGRFRSNATFHATLDLIATVARHAAERDGSDPEDIGRVRFDRARDELALPLASAQGLVKRLRLPLPTLIWMALKPAAGRAQAAGPDHKNATPDDFPASVVLRAIRAAGHRLGATPGTLDYDEMVAADHRAREAAGFSTLGLPHSSTIARQFGSWDKALKAAGFDVTARGRAEAARAPEPAEVIVDRFLDEHGFIPNSGYLVEYCRLTNTPLGRDAKPQPALIERTRILRATAGKWTPSQSMPSRAVPSAAKLSGWAATLRPERAEFTEADAIASLQLYGAQARRDGQIPTYRGYKKFARGNADLVSATTLGRLGGFAALSEKAGL